MITKCKNLNKKRDKIPLMQFKLFFVFLLQIRCLQENVHGRLLSILVFSSDGHYGMIESLRGGTLSRRVINLKPIRIGENLVVNCKY